MIESREAPERSLEETVSRALRDNLVPLKRTATELEQAFADFVAACSSARPSNSLPAMLRAQACAASLSASLSALSNFTAIALNSPGLASGTVAEERSRQPAVASVAVVSEERPAAAHHAPVATPHREELQLEPVPEIHAAHAEPASSQPVHAQELELEPYPATHRPRRMAKSPRTPQPYPRAQRLLRRLSTFRLSQPKFKTCIAAPTG